MICSFNDSLDAAYQEMALREYRISLLLHCFFSPSRPVQPASRSANSRYLVASHIQARESGQLRCPCCQWLRPKFSLVLPKVTEEDGWKQSANPIYIGNCSHWCFAFRTPPLYLHPFRVLRGRRTRGRAGGERGRAWLLQSFSYSPH